MNLITRFAGLILCMSLSVCPLFAQTPTPTPYPDFLLDHNGDGAINSKDLLILIQKWGLQGIVTPTPSPTLTRTPTHAPTDTPTITPTPSPTETPTNPDSITVDVAVHVPVPMRFVRIPAGSFMMGSPDTERSRETDEGPVHQVTIDYDFYMSETEVTQAQWEGVMELNPAIDFGVGSNYPVYNVSWDHCQVFIAALNALGQGTFRLPSESEWEYACRAGSITRFYFGDSLNCSSDECVDCDVAKGVIFIEMRSEYMWFCPNGGTSAHPVREKFMNGFGLFDMAGNVYEWCQDSYQSDYMGAPTDGSAWESGGGDGSRVLRGGGWSHDARDCRSANRRSSEPNRRYPYAGFRLARTP